MAVSRDKIRALADEIAMRFHPRRIVLFGSHASGEAGKDSDVDLLVVMAHKGSSARASADILNTVDPDFPVDLIVRSPAVMRHRLQQRDYFLEEIMTRGEVLVETAGS